MDFLNKAEDVFSPCPDPIIIEYIFLIAMKLANVSWLKRHIAYYSVRLFGNKHYKVD